MQVKRWHWAALAVGVAMLMAAALPWLSAAVTRRVADAHAGGALAATFASWASDDEHIGDEHAAARAVEALAYIERHYRWEDEPEQVSPTVRAALVDARADAMRRLRAALSRYAGQDLATNEACMEWAKRRGLAVRW